MRSAFYAVALIAVTAVALVAYRRATETVVIERPTLGGPPPEASRTIASLVGEKLPFISGSVAEKMHNRVVVVSSRSSPIPAVRRRATHSRSVAVKPSRHP